MVTQCPSCHTDIATHDTTGNIISKMKEALEAKDIWKWYLPSEPSRYPELPQRTSCNACPGGYSYDYDPCYYCGASTGIGPGLTDYPEYRGQTTKPCLFHEGDLQAKCICGKPRVCPDCGSQLAFKGKEGGE
jgi:hypothetical protein